MVRVAAPVLLTGQKHRRALNQGRKLLAGDIGRYAVAQGLKLVIGPELKTLDVEFRAGYRERVTLNLPCPVERVGLLGNTRYEKKG
jgi:hypothetical protein